MKRHTISEEYVPGIHPGLLHSTRLAYPQSAAAERHFGRKHIENIEFEALKGNVIYLRNYAALSMGVAHRYHLAPPWGCDGKAPTGRKMKASGNAR